MRTGEWRNFCEDVEQMKWLQSGTKAPGSDGPGRCCSGYDYETQEEERSKEAKTRQAQSHETIEEVESSHRRVG